MSVVRLRWALPCAALLVAACTSTTSPSNGSAQAADTGAGGDESASDGGAAESDVAAAPFDCETIETHAPGFADDPIDFAYVPDVPATNPSGTKRNIVQGRVYQRVKVEQFSGAEDTDPPVPTLIAFQFVEGSNQLEGEYCIAQAYEKDGKPAVGHFRASFVPRRPGSTTDFMVKATMMPPSSGSFPIGFDGDETELFVHVSDGFSAYRETYRAVQP